MPCAEPAANLIRCPLEPRSEYGFIRFWKFKIVPDRGGLFAFYRLAKSPELPVVPYKN